MDQTKTKCLIVDDEPLALRVIASHLDKIADMKVVASCTSAIEAYRIVQHQKIDLVFLDIEMPNLTGIDFIKSLETPPAVIFTTAYRDYALEGFELDVIDYLMKPVALPRLLRALDKYRRQHNSKIERMPATQQPAYITVRSNRQTLRLDVGNLLFIESLSDYVKIHTSERVIVSKERISHLAEKLEALGFLRVHRSFLISTSQITAFTADEISIKHHKIPVSRSYREEVKKRLADLIR